VDRLGWSAFDDNEKLKTLLKLRLAHPDASLSELAHSLSVALNTDISRSNVNHLFRDLDAQYKIAQQKLAAKTKKDS
jgi:DNA-binding transcriptional regulator WhiA